MSVRRMIMLVALAVMMVLGGIVAVRGVGRATEAKARNVELASGKALDGTLMKIRGGSYLLQTDRDCLVLSGDQIRRIDGRDVTQTEIEVSERVPLEYETFEVAGADGSLEMHSKFKRSNDGREAISRLDWGVAAHEVGRLADSRVLDEFGNELEMRVEDDPSIHGKRVRVDLARPVLPGETLEFTDITRHRNGVVRDRDVWVYRHRGDYPEDRLVTRSVLLPPGAAVVSVHPEPIHNVSVGDRKLVVWRRYFRAGEVIPWEIRYRL